MNRNATIAVIVVLLLASVTVGIIGYFSDGFQNWESFGAEPAEPAEPEEPTVPEEPAVPATYTPIEVGDIVTRLYFNKDFDFVSFFEERFPGGMTGEKSYLEIKTGDISLIVVYSPVGEGSEKPVVAILEEHQAAPFYVSEKVVIPNGNEDGSDIVWEPGWSIEEDYIDFAEFGNNFRITEIHGQNLFKYFISTDGVFAEL